MKRLLNYVGRNFEIFILAAFGFTLIREAAVDDRIFWLCITVASIVAGFIDWCDDKKRPQETGDAG